MHLSLLFPPAHAPEQQKLDASLLELSRLRPCAILSPPPRRRAPPHEHQQTCRTEE